MRMASSLSSSAISKTSKAQVMRTCGNIGVSVGADGILIVDDQFAPLAQKIEAALKQLNPGKLKFVLNTHYHGYHTGGNAHFGREASIIAHSNVRKRLGGKAGDSKP